ncbi:winged helix-turn-helix domain-containing protein [Sandaracinobacter sp. RS1-74]|uniref:winged helix-turn-helix domain-containing protein n=1 Tax=Sandaracinobacteroides sayramensis TaxID=2913411 RepID=UPI001EDB8D2F|nr:winged helix-turn-helix domain-containing protein [Sandaracinobacteroides sayramensis]MCG2841549.1 winged helix-turn-helix domain-containing protein [Sandaracinobacteroides sayramensis]
MPPSARRRIEPARRARLALGDLHLLPPERSVAGPAGTVQVEPRVMQLLLALADAKGEVAPREALLEQCWDGVVVGDDSLNRAIAGARRALKDAGTACVAIETIPKLGYRLLAEDLPPVAEPALESGKGPVARRALLAGGVALGLAGVAGARFLWRRPAAGDPRVEALIAESDRALRLAIPEASQQGVGHLREAVALDPGHAPAWGKLAMALQQAAQFSPPGPMLKLKEEARQAAEQALRLEPGLLDARAALAALLPLFGHWGEAVAALEELAAEAPGHLPTKDALAFARASSGLIGLHYPLRRETVASDPMHAGYNFRSIYGHWMVGNVAEADRAGARGLDLWPRHFATWLARYTVFAHTGRADRALAMVLDEGTRPRMSPAFLHLSEGLARALADGDSASRAAAAEAQLQSVRQEGPIAAVQAAIGLAALGEIDGAYDVAEAYLLERGRLMVATSWRPGQTRHNDAQRRHTNFLFLPMMGDFRADPRFAGLVRDMGLARFWRESGHRPDYLGGAPLP